MTQGVVSARQEAKDRESEKEKDGEGSWCSAGLPLIVIVIVIVVARISGRDDIPCDFLLLVSSWPVHAPKFVSQVKTFFALALPTRSLWTLSGAASQNK